MSSVINPFINPVNQNSSVEVQEHTIKKYIRSVNVDFNFSVTLEYLRDIKYLLGIKKLGKPNSDEFEKKEKIFTDHSNGKESNMNNFIIKEICNFYKICSTKLFIKNRYPNS